MKKILIVFVFLLTACSSNKLDIGLVLYNEADPFVDVFAEQIIEKISEHSFEVYDSENSQVLQNAQLEELIDMGVKLFVVNPVDRLSAFTLIRKLEVTNTPVIFFNREPLRKDLEEYDKAYYVGAKAEQSGFMQAELVEELFGSPLNLNEYDRNGDNIIQLLLFKGEQGHQDAELRSKFVIETLEDKGYQVEIIQTVIADWMRSKAYESMKEIVQDEIFYELIISNNDAMAVGVIEAMRENEVFKDDNENGLIDSLDSSWVPIVGVDGIDLAVNEIENGYMYGTVLNDSESMAEAIAELSSFLLEGRDLSEMSFDITDDYYIWIDYEVFKNN